MYGGGERKRHTDLWPLSPGLWDVFNLPLLCVHANSNWWIWNSRSTLTPFLFYWHSPHFISSRRVAAGSVCAESAHLLMNNKETQRGHVRRTHHRIYAPRGACGWALLTDQESMTAHLQTHKTRIGAKSERTVNTLHMWCSNVLLTAHALLTADFNHMSASERSSYIISGRGS